MLLKAYAKLNLSIRVLDTLENGYHNLEMINVKIDLYDEIEINEAKEMSITYSNFNISYNNDIIHKSLELLKDMYPIPNYNIYINKNIPVGAGLGGASSDAAAIIKYICNEHNIIIDDNLKKKLSIISTDIIYCLHDEPCLVKGVGEIIETININTPDQVLILNPNINISTKDVFNLVNNNYTSIYNKEYIENNNLISIMENHLEQYACYLHPDLNQYIYDLKAYDLKKVQMTGSGSTVFAIDEKENLEIAQKELKERYPDFLIGVYNIMKGNNIMDLEVKKEQVELEEVENENKEVVDEQAEERARLDAEDGFEYTQVIERDDIYKLNWYLRVKDGATFTKRLMFTMIGIIFIVLSIVQKDAYYMIPIGAVLALYSTVLYIPINKALFNKKFEKQYPVEQHNDLIINVKLGTEHIRYEMPDEVNSPLVSWKHIYKVIEKEDYIYLHINQYSILLLKTKDLPNKNVLTTTIKRRIQDPRRYYKNK